LANAKWLKIHYYSLSLLYRAQHVRILQAMK
jgi:hypothetical protein